MTIVTNIIQILVAGFTSFAKGLGQGLNDFVTNVFVTSEGALTTFGEVVIVFAAISLTLGLSRWVVNMVTSLGSRNK